MGSSFEGVSMVKGYVAGTVGAKAVDVVASRGGAGVATTVDKNVKCVGVIRDGKRRVGVVCRSEIGRLDA
jgi:creatinine amidohydrolase/Fe(II)-dependent formamide hydrolase-like protein